MSEHDEQAAFVAEVLYRYANNPNFVRGLFFSTFNGAWLGGSKRARGFQMFKAKAAGFLPGVADILYLQPRGHFYYLAIEMKTKTGRLSPEQDQFLTLVKEEGGGCAWVCRGASEAVARFADYMNLFNPDFWEARP